MSFIPLHFTFRSNFSSEMAKNSFNFEKTKKVNLGHQIVETNEE